MSTNPEPSVLWREGMFLCPQHMQAFSREVGSRIARHSSVGFPGAYGLRSLELNEEALGRDTFEIRAAEAIFADGTIAVFPDNASVELREFGRLFRDAELEVFLGIPSARPNVPQIAEDNGRVARYRVEPQQVFDENMRDASLEIEFRHLQGRIFFGNEDRTGFECLPIARIERRGQPEAVSCLSETYVPPIVGIGASPVLARALKDISAEARSQARDLAGRIPATTLLSSVAKGADLAGFVKLQAVNRSVANIEQLVGQPELHPFDAYMWLVQAVGSLAVFSEERVVPENPIYDHAKLNECFGAVLDSIRELLAADVAIPYDRATFEADPMHEGFFECQIPDDWFRFQPDFFLAVRLARPAEEVVRLVAGGLKLVSKEDLPHVLQGVVPGIGLAYLQNPPLAFPKRPELHFFRVEMEGPSRKGWLKVLSAKTAMLLSTLGAVGDVRYHFYVELRR